MNFYFQIWKYLRYGVGIGVAIGFLLGLISYYNASSPLVTTIETEYQSSLRMSPLRSKIHTKYRKLSKVDNNYVDKQQRSQLNGKNDIWNPRPRLDDKKYFVDTQKSQSDNKEYFSDRQRSRADSKKSFREIQRAPPNVTLRSQLDIQRNTKPIKNRAQSYQTTYLEPRLSVNVKVQKEGIITLRQQVDTVKSSIMKPPHVVDGHIWAQMIKYYPQVSMID